MEIESVFTGAFSMGAVEGGVGFFRLLLGEWAKAPFNTSLTWETGIKVI